MPGLLYSDETRAHRTLFALMKTGKIKKMRTRMRHEKYEMCIWIMSLRICRYPDVSSN